MTKGDTALTPKQKQWFAAVRAGLEAETGKTLEQWAAIARATCPETAHRARLKWFKDVHGLGQNRASAILDAAFGSIGWDAPDALRAALWGDPEQAAILAAIEASVGAFDAVTIGQRKAYTAFSRTYQFAALAPVKVGGARLGLALDPRAHAALAPAKSKEPWSERLRAVLIVPNAAAVKPAVRTLLRAAYDAS